MSRMKFWRGRLRGQHTQSEGLQWWEEHRIRTPALSQHVTEQQELAEGHDVVPALPAQQNVTLPPLTLLPPAATNIRTEVHMFKAFRNFLLRGDVIVVAVGLVVALAFSNLVKAFTDNVISPLIAAIQGQGMNGPGLGWQLVAGGGTGTYLNLGAFISAIIYFIIYMAVVYFLIVVPYKYVMARRGQTVFGDPAPTQTCPECRSDDLPIGAVRCRHCGSAIVHQ